MSGLKNAQVESHSSKEEVGQMVKDRGGARRIKEELGAFGLLFNLAGGEL